MRIRVTEIEATAEDLRQSTSLASAFQNALRRAFVCASTPVTAAYDEEEDGEEEHDQG